MGTLVGSIKKVIATQDIIATTLMGSILRGETFVSFLGGLVHFVDGSRN